MQKRTSLMRRVEREQGADLVQLLPPLINELGMSAAADKLQVSKATLNYWCLRLGLQIQRVVVARGESVSVTKAPGP